MSGEHKQAKASNPDDERVGSTLENRYRIIELLAQGGMGLVYRGERIGLSRPVAIKFLHASFAADAAARDRFERELQAMSRLTHPNCVSVVDFGIADSPYIVMEFVTGRTLKDVVKQEGRVPAGRALYIASQIVAALAHAHSQDMVHRDIKPANIILADVEGTLDHVYVLDFGLAKFLSGASNELTASWMVLGTPAYMSPEQGRAESIGPFTDIYATGVVLFELLTGSKPYEADNPIDTIQQHQSAPVPSIRERLPEAEFSEELDAVLRKAMAKKPAERFPTAAAFAEALEQVPEIASRISTRISVVNMAAKTPPRGATNAGLNATVPLSSSDIQEVAPGASAAQASGNADAPETRVATPDGLAAKARRTGEAAASADSARAPTASEPSVGASLTAVLQSKKKSSSSTGETTPSRATPASGTRAATVASGPSKPKVDPRRLMLAAAFLAAAALVPYFVSRGSSELPGEVGLVSEVGVSGDGDTSGDGEPAAAPNGDSDGDGDSDQGTSARAGDGAKTAAADAGGGDAGAEDEPEAVTVNTVKDVEKLIEEGRREDAIKGIQHLRRTEFPKSGYLALLLGHLYFDKVFWGDGIDAYIDAIRLKRDYRSNAKLNENAIKALSHDASRFKVYTLYRKHIRHAGLKYLRKAAKSDSNPKVRSRASFLIKEITKRRR